MTVVKGIYEFAKRSKVNNTPEKDKIRNLTISYIHNFYIDNQISRARFLTLPSAWWRFEKLITERFYNFWHFRVKPSFVGCERDWNLFSMASVRMPKSNKILKQALNNEMNCQVVANGSNYVLFNTDIFNFMAHTDKKFNCIWIDTQTPVSYILDKLPLINKVIMDQSLFILTVLKGREHIQLPTDRIECVTNAISDLGFTLAHSWEYFDTSPMLHLIYKKTNP